MEKQSLAASSGTLTEVEPFQVPAIFQEPNDKVVGKFNTPYIAFAHKERADEHAKLVGKFGVVDEGDMFLVEPNELTHLRVAKLSIMKIKQYWVEKDAAGKVLRASFNEMPWPWAEHMDAVALVHLPDRLVVVNINPHSTKCSGFKTLADALEECQTPQWGDKSPAHKETMQISQPFMRFFAEMTVASPRIGKKTGRPYRTTNCVIKPTTNVEAKLLREFSQNPEAGKALQDAAERYMLRIREIEDKAKK